MNKYAFLIAVAAGSIFGASSAHAQVAGCPYGYTCVPISQAYVPVTCPYGFTCTPINPSYPTIPSYPSYPSYPQYPTYPTQPTYPPTNTAGPLRITSPNGGESWQTGTTHTIQWTSPAYFRATYADLKLVRTMAPCSGICPMYMLAPYTIASNLSINQNSYSWNVGQAYQGSLNASSFVSVPDGQYTVQICESGTSNCDSSDSSFTIYSGSTGYPANTGYQTPTISGIDAPTTLAVNQAGTWTIHAADPQNGTLSYTVDWGDNALPPYNAMSSSGIYTQTTSFTHSYTTTGTYTVVFTVRNNAGLTAQSRTTVYVGTNGSTQPLTVLSPNGGESWKRGTQQAITWTTQSGSYPYYSGYPNTTGYVRITLDYRCPMGMYCTAMYRPPYVIQSSAPNSGSSAWSVGTATLDGSSAVSVPNGTYVVTVCRYDASNQPAGCDSSNSSFTITD